MKYRRGEFMDRENSRGDIKAPWGGSYNYINLEIK